MSLVQRSLISPGDTVRRVCVGLTTLCVLTFMARADRLLRRGNESTLEGRAVQVDDNGVLFRTARGADTAEALITWDRIRFLESDRASFTEFFEQHRDMAENLWRARTRIERLDYAAAEPLLEPLFVETMNRTDATALTVAEGVLRCRLARGARAAAVIPWLEMHRQLESGLKPTAYLDMDPIVDAQTGVCPQLPPIWMRSVGVEQLLAELGHYVVDAPATERLARLYTRAARLALGLPVQDPSIFYHADESWQRDPASLLITTMVAAVEQVTPYPIDLDRTFSRLYREEGMLTPWAWFARGLTRIAASDLNTQREGLVDLLTLPARYRETHAYLSGFAIDFAARTFERLGRHADAALLRADLKRDYPTHPLNDAPSSPRVAASEKKP